MKKRNNRTSASRTHRTETTRRRPLTTLIAPHASIPPPEALPSLSQTDAAFQGSQPPPLLPVSEPDPQESLPALAPSPLPDDESPLPLEELIPDAVVVGSFVVYSNFAVTRNVAKILEWYWWRVYTFSLK
ncbi:hypothetical protein DPMN_003241 [Dreissena polymorpha]|uniref:Uncharacterized protein n=1 Tax=Dreissena polymorpha TaxID=45954 RepID=A0A9D4MPA7_DREPO|nr:hypothetical protein DPMN_003241 [Dreissena polymorpha]